MPKRLLIVSLAGLGLVLPALASDRGDDMGRIQKATQVFQETMRTPDQGLSNRTTPLGPSLGHGCLY